jgi:hypothetical protein
MALTRRCNAFGGAQAPRKAADVAQLQLRQLTTFGFWRSSMSSGFVMRRVALWTLVFCVVAQFGGCKSSTVSEVAPEAPLVQTRPRDNRLARLYFLREKGLVATEVGIKVDGKQVGSVATGFYFFSEKTPGRYRIACVNPISMDYESEIEIESGKTYYFGIGTPQVTAPGQNLLNQALAGSSGQQMRPTSALMGGFSGAALYQIDAAEGPSVISQLKPQ